MSLMSFESHNSTLSSEELHHITESFKGKKILVIGDVMIDAYWWGNVERISPEAPVPVVNIKRIENRLGGAANVALNLKKLGAHPIICASIGEDAEGAIFTQLLVNEGITTEGLITISRPTTVKMRIIGNNNQMLRVDNEDDKLLNAEESKYLQDKILNLITQADAVVFEDYDKGLISSLIIENIIKAAQELKIPVVVDPKRRNFAHYKHATVFKPNLRELADGLKIDLDNSSDIKEIESAAHLLRENLSAECVLITLSERGVFVCTESYSQLLPAHFRNIYDVSGAGDTVISVAALSLLSGAGWGIMAALANLAGGLVCEKSGVVPLSIEELKSEALKVLCF